VTWSYVPPGFRAGAALSLAALLITLLLAVAAARGRSRRRRLSAQPGPPAVEAAARSGALPARHPTAVRPGDGARATGCALGVSAEPSGAELNRSRLSRGRAELDATRPLVRQFADMRTHRQRTKLSGRADQAEASDGRQAGP